MSDAPLEIKNLDLNVDQRGIQYKLCEKINFSLRPAEIFAVIGPNGSGKTTLLKSLAGLIPNQKNSIFLYGRDIFDYSARERSRWMAYHPQSPKLHSDLIVKDLVVLGRTPLKSHLAGWSSSDYEKVEFALKMVGLQNFSNRRSSSLSGGELQRAFLARMLTNEAKIFLMDEPTTFLDIGRTLDFLDILKTLRSKGYTIICAMHDLNLVKKFSDRILIFSGQKSWKLGSVEEILNKKVIQKFFQIKPKLWPKL